MLAAAGAVALLKVLAACTVHAFVAFGVTAVSNAQGSSCR